MAWPTATTPAEAYSAITSEIRSLKITATDLKAKSAAGTLRRDEAANFSPRLDNARTLISSMLSVSGLDAYVKDQTNNPTFDTIAEGNARVTAIVGMRDWLVSNFPAGAGSMILEKSFDANGQLVVGTFTAGQTAALRTQIDTFLAGLS